MKAGAIPAVSECTLREICESQNDLEVWVSRPTRFEPTQYGCEISRCLGPTRMAERLVWNPFIGTFDGALAQIKGILEKAGVNPDIVHRIIGDLVRDHISRTYLPPRINPSPNSQQ